MRSASATHTHRERHANSGIWHHVLTDTEMKCGAPEAEKFALVKLVEKYRAYLGSAFFKLRVDIQSLSWLKTYSVEQRYIGSWIIKLDGCDLDMLLPLNLVQHELSRININSLSLLDKSVQFTPEGMLMLRELCQREVTRDEPEWAAAMAFLTVSELARIRTLSCQHKENERDYRTVVHQLVYSIPQIVLMRTSYHTKKRTGDWDSEKDSHLRGTRSRNDRCRIEKLRARD